MYPFCWSSFIFCHGIHTCDQVVSLAYIWDYYIVHCTHFISQTVTFSLPISGCPVFIFRLFCVWSITLLCVKAQCKGLEETSSTFCSRSKSLAFLCIVHNKLNVYGNFQIELKHHSLLMLCCACNLYFSRSRLHVLAFILCVQSITKCVLIHKIFPKLGENVCGHAMKYTLCA